MTATQGLDNCYIWHFDSDLDLIALVNGGEKQLLPVCSIVHKAFQQSVPDIQLQYHKHSQMTSMVEAVLFNFQ